MKIRYLKFKNWLIMSVMGLLGLNACHSQKRVAKGDVVTETLIVEPDPNRYVVMYGVPSTDYKVDSAVSPQDPKRPTSPEPREPQVTVYGVPTCDFTVKGRVVDSKGRPVKGVQVALVNSEIDIDNLPDTPHWMERLATMSDTTDAQGNFEVHTSDRPWENQRLMVNDIDGAKNGDFQNQLLDVEFEDSDVERKGTAWRVGAKKAEVTVKMKYKTKSNPKK